MATEQRQPSVPLPGAGAPRSTEPRAGGDGPDRRGGASTGLVVLALLAGLVVGALGAMLLDDSDDGDPFAGRIDDDRYQAVILSNDKVYFGRLSEASSTFFALDDAFFLREVRQDENAEPERALLPVNAELHAPENRMLIRRDDVVLVENLDEESPVLTEIRRQKDE
ncbi:MAG TPA: hypothetical protein VFV35_00595 [Acidimicrobiales bacterium]|nr:hypothetical protein [Acidimicrobiales bacterium]